MEIPPACLDSARFCEVSRTVGRPCGRAAQLPVATGGSGAPASAAGDGTQGGSRKSKGRDWSAYNQAQTHEATKVMALLGHMSDLISAAAAPVRGLGAGVGSLILWER